LPAATTREVTVPSTPAYRVLIDAIAHLGRVQRGLGATMARDLDCPRTSLSLLWLLDKSGPLGIGDIAQHLHVDISVASRQATALVDAGYAERLPSPVGTDRRVRPIGLTPAGKDFTARTKVEMDERAAILFGTWDVAELLTAADSLRKIADTMAAHGDALRAASEARAAAAEPTTGLAGPTTPGVLAGTAT
jgi:DNA-binding MarR family transcriptional regulator